MTLSSALSRHVLKETVAAFHERHTREARVVRNVAYLRSFDDRLLLDIGLNRTDIEAYVRRRLGQKV